MKIIIARLGERLRGSSRGTSLAELMTAMAISGFIIAAIFTVMAPLFHITTSNSNYMAAFHEVQTSGEWISRDALMAQGVYEMASTNLRQNIDDIQVSIPVYHTTGFPPSGVVCIDDELIQYNNKTENTFEGCTRGYNATDHAVDQAASFFVAMSWPDWDGNRYIVVYNLKEASNYLMRSYLYRGALEVTYTILSSTRVAKAIDSDATISNWDYKEKELTVEISATVGDYILLKTDIWEATAVNTYKINPRPFF